MDWYSAPLQAVFDLILPLFTLPTFAYSLATTFVASGLFCLFAAGAQTGLGHSSLRRRNQVLQRILARSPDAPRQAFATGWQDVETTMLSGRGHFDRRLAAGWSEFKETLIDESATPIRNTARPIEFLGDAVRSPNWLEFAANMFVGLGLLCTFLGLVAALHEASEGISNASVDAMQDALRNLLMVASTKFITSIVGVGLSILLKFFDRLFARILREETQRLCSLIEDGLLNSPTQALLSDQLHELREQTKQIKILNTELAVKIGDRLDQSFQSAMTPMLQSIQTLGATIASTQEKQAEAIRDGVRGGLSSATGHEMSTVAASLKQLAQGLVSLHSAVRTSGSAASEQIVGAADQFANVVGDMRSAFAEMAQRISASGDALNSQTRDQVGAMVGRIEQGIGLLLEASQRQQEQFDITAKRLRSESESAAQRMEHVMRSSGDAAGLQISAAAAQFGQVVTMMKTAFEEAAQRSTASSAALNNQAVGQLDAIAQRLQSALSAIGEVNDRQLRQSEEADARMRTNAAETAERFGEMAEQFSRRFAQEAGDGLHATMQTVGASLAASLGSAQEAIDASSNRLGQVIKLSVKHMEVALESFARVSQGLDSNASALDAIAAQSRSASTQLGSAAVTFGAAGTTTTAAASEMAKVAGDLSRMIKGVADSLEQARVLHASISETQTGVSEAWSAYKKRFEAVDENLGDAAAKLAAVYADAHERLRGNVSDMDGKLAQAVSSLGSLIQPLSDSVEELQGLAAQNRIQRAAAG